MRVASFNIHGGQGSDRWHPTRGQLRAITADIKRIDPDVLLLQEVDVFAARSLWRNQVRWLRRKLRPTGFTAAAPNRRLSGRMQNLAIMTFHEWTLTSPQRLVFRGSDVPEPRSALAATLTDDRGLAVLAVTAHLTGGSDLDPRTIAIQDREIGGIAEAVAAIPGPVIFGADTNTRAASALGARERELLGTAQLEDAFTISSIGLESGLRATDVATAEDGSGGRGAVDQLYLSRHWLRCTARVDRSVTSSDHFPLIADIRFSDE